MFQLVWNKGLIFKFSIRGCTHQFALSDAPYTFPDKSSLWQKLPSDAIGRWNSPRETSRAVQHRPTPHAENQQNRTSGERLGPDLFSEPPKAFLLEAVLLVRSEWSLSIRRVKAQTKRVQGEALALICKDLALTHYGMDQYNSAWKEIKNVEILGFACAPEFVAKVRKTLMEQGINPDEEDKKARAVLRQGTIADTTPIEETPEK